MGIRRFVAVGLALGLLLLACGGEEPEQAAPGTPQESVQAPSAATSPTETSSPTNADPAPPESLEELASYEGDDWLDVMRSGASDEGTMSVYTAIPPETIQPLLDEFTSDFGVEVELYSATTEDIRNRLLQEQDASRFTVDLVLGGDALEHLILDSEGALQAYTTPSAAEYGEEFGQPGRTWYPLYENYFVAAYNTDLIDAAAVPTTYEAVLDEQWQGQLGIEASDVGWYATLMDEWGESEGNTYFEALAAQRPFVVSGHTTLTNLVVSGEVPFAITVYNYRAESEKQAGAPIDWVALEPAVAIFNGVAVPRQAPHPHASLALAEFLLSEQGQVQLAELTGQIPSHPNVPADPPSLKEGFESVPTSYELLLEDYDSWQTRWEETIINGQPTLGDS